MLGTIKNVRLKVSNGRNDCIEMMHLKHRMNSEICCGPMAMQYTRLYPCNILQSGISNQ